RLGGEGGDPGERWRAHEQLLRKAVELGALDLDHDAVAVVEDEAGQVALAREPVDERPEPDALHHAPGAVPAPSDGRVRRHHAWKVDAPLRERIGAAPEAAAGKPQAGSVPVPMASSPPTATLPVMTRVLPGDALDALVAALLARGFRVIGPVVRGGAIVYDDLGSAADLPVGWTDVQDGGSYRLERRDDDARFGYAVGPTSWKRFLLPPKIRLWRATQRPDGLEVEEEQLENAPLAFVGVRPCELAAIAIQD